jgi:hypothetical protein
MYHLLRFRYRSVSRFSRFRGFTLKIIEKYHSLVFIFCRPLSNKIGFAIQNSLALSYCISKIIFYLIFCVCTTTVLGT